MLNRSASLAMSTCVLKALPDKLDIKRHSPSILYKQSKKDSKDQKLIHCHRIPNVLGYQDTVVGGTADPTMAGPIFDRVWFWPYHLF